MLLKDAFAYDAASRLKTVADNAGDTATYSYLANSALVSNIVFAQSGATRMTTTKQYDFINRLLSVVSTPVAAVSASDAYQYNSANQRTRSTLADGSYWVYGYDSLGQVVSGKKYWSDGTSVAGQQFEYTFDTIGNRTTAKAGGDSTGAGLCVSSYTANNLNQYSQRTVPGAVDITGISYATYTVGVNGQSPYRKGEYFRAQLTMDNSALPLWTNITVTATGQTPVAGGVFVAKSPEILGYELDGNLQTDGRGTYTWDAENRLIQMAARTSVGPQQTIAFSYDWMGRRIQKQVSVGGIVTTNALFLYDGWNLIGVLNSSFILQRSFMWGQDLSGSMQGAGGVGGLLEVSDTANGTHFAAFDGNGNVTALISATGGTNSAQYEYGPFGELIRSTGPARGINPFRFSTKYQDDETDLVMYPCRPYRDGRFLSRDPIEEARGFNLYGFVNNSPVNVTDPLGLVIDTHCDPIDDYLKSLGISFQRSGSYHYTFSGTDLGTGPATAKMIVTRMLFAGTVFTVSSTGGSATANLKKHVEARLTIVRNALKANFLFGTGTFHFDSAAFQKDPQAYFDSLNNGNTVIACAGLARLIFETGNKFAPQGIRPRSGPTAANLVWIPGDWGWIQNRNYGPGWKSGYEGENVFHTGTSAEGEMFWGHFKPEVHPAMSESWWFDFVKHWPGPGGQGGDPQWRDAVKYPTIGLDRPTTAP